jgi:hypothetical protein
LDSRVQIERSRLEMSILRIHPTLNCPTTNTTKDMIFCAAPTPKTG